MPSQREIATEWEQLAGLVCVCNEGCTTDRWGDGVCKPECEPCRRMKGRTYHPPPKGGKKV